MAMIAKDGVEFMLETLKTQGVAVSTVSDGTVLIFKRELLQEILDKHPDSPTLSIFVKRPDFKG